MSKSDGRLQKWADANAPSDYMLYKDAFWQQISFVRDRVAGLLARTYEQCCDLVDVVSTHCSKSIILPVYHIALPQDRCEFWMRNNFYNWNVSYLGCHPLDCDFLNCFDDSGSYLFCEGMEEWRYGSHANDPSRFTVCVWNDYDLYVFFRAVKKRFGIMPQD